MEEHRIEEVARNLAALLAKGRREAAAYTLLTVLCTPAFVAIASLVVLSMLLYIVHRSDYGLDNAAVIYTGMTLFLASAVGLVTPGTNRRAGSFEFSRSWLAGVAAFVVLLAITYLTSLQERMPAFFAAVYFVLAFLVLGLVGRTLIDHPSERMLGEPPTVRAFALSIAGFIVSAYAELLSASWLWVPPKPEEVRVAARVLCRLEAADRGPLQERILDERVERLLLRLKLVQRIDQRLCLTPKGAELTRAAAPAPRPGN